MHIYFVIVNIEYILGVKILQKIDKDMVDSEKSGKYSHLKIKKNLRHRYKCAYSRQAGF